MGKRKRSRRPNIDGMEKQMEHSEEHRGETGKFGDFFSSDLPYSTWSPNEDEHNLAIVPYFVKEGESDFRSNNPDLNRPFSEEQIDEDNTWDYKLSLLVHNNIGVNKDAVVCLNSLKKPCPICELRAELYEEDEDSKQASNLGVSRRAIYMIICFDNKKEKKKGIQIWNAPQASIEEELIKRAKDRKTGDFKNFGILEENWNIFFEKSGSGLKTEYEGVDVIEREDEFEEEDLEDIYGEMEDFNLEDFITVLSYKELKTMLKGTKDEEEEDEKPRRPRKKEGTKRKRRPVKDEEEEGIKKRKGRNKRSRDRKEKPSCFGVSFDKIEKCEECDQKIFEACMRAYEAENDDDDDIPF